MTARAYRPVNDNFERERRSHHRPRTLKHVKIMLDDSVCIYDGLMRNISAHGARLETSISGDMPDFFKVIVVSSGEKMRANLKWRTLDHIGISFA